jgi:glycosyltransferase involved in cell wall biosynthesis
MKIGLISMVKNEERLVAEFICHHLALGIERVHILDNNSTDGTADILRRLGTVFPGVTFEPWSGDHVSAFNHGVRQLRGTVDWLFAGDTDEFIVPTSAFTLHEFLTHMGAHAAIGLHWLIFGSSNLHDDPPDLYTATFLRRAHFQMPVNRHVKSIVRPELVQGTINSHVFSLDERHFPYMNAAAQRIGWHERIGLAATEPVFEPFRLHHYFCRNRGAWEDKKSRAIEATGFFARTEDDWVHHDRNDVYDASAFLSSERTREFLERAGLFWPYNGSRSADQARSVYAPDIRP